MQKIFAISLIAASLAAFPAALTTPTFAVDSSIAAKCGPDGPESYKRPGGFCDQVGSNDSLVDADGCQYIYLPASFDMNAPAKKMLVADYCYAEGPVIL